MQTWKFVASHENLTKESVCYILGGIRTGEHLDPDQSRNLDLNIKSLLVEASKVALGIGRGSVM